MEACAPDWPGLMPELLGKIADMLFVEDFLAFRCVCPSWRAAAVGVNYKPEPLLMKRGEKYREFYSLLRRKVCIRKALPEADRKRCIPAGFGWIVTVAESGEATLLNPLSRALIPLPGHELFSRTKIMPVLTADPDSKTFVLFMLFDYRIMSWRVGDENWKTFESGSWNFFNIYYCCKRFYGITYDGKIWVDGTKGKAELFLASLDLQSMVDGLLLDKSWLMESSDDSDQLILLIRYQKLLLHRSLDGWISWRFSEYCYRAFRIDVLKRTWKEVKDLNGEAVFAGNYYTGIAVPASSSEPNGPKPNSIYVGYTVGDIAVHDSTSPDDDVIKPIDTYFSSHGFGSYLCLETPNALSYEGPINSTIRNRRHGSGCGINRCMWI